MSAAVGSVPINGETNRRDVIDPDRFIAVSTEAFGFEPKREPLVPQNESNPAVADYITRDDTESDFSSVQGLIETLQPKRKALDKLREHYFVEIAWNGYSDRMQAGFLIPADLLAAMGALGIDFHGQVFFKQTGTAAVVVDEG
ncbi:MAG: hypothetical protein H7226_06765 [Salinibacterium sp.]|nr:hypothetical protein [Salinibacterium sp.]